MAKSKPPPIVKMPTIGSGFEDFFNDDSIDVTTSDESITPAAESSKVTETPVKPSSQPTTKEPKKVIAKSPRKKKAVSTKAVRPKDPVVEVQSTPPPSTNFIKEELDWFFTNPVPIGQPKQLYVELETKETLHVVAKAAGIPIGNLTDNIIRWFLLSNKTEITKMMARRNPYQRLDS